MKYSINPTPGKNYGNVEVKIIIEDVIDYKNFYNYLRDSTKFGDDLWLACEKNRFHKEEKTI